MIKFHFQFCERRFWAQSQNVYYCLEANKEELEVSLIAAKMQLTKNVCLVSVTLPNKYGVNANDEYIDPNRKFEFVCKILE